MTAHLVTKTDFYSIYQSEQAFLVQAGDFIKSLPVQTLEEAEEFVIEHYYELKSL